MALPLVASALGTIGGAWLGSKNAAAQREQAKQQMLMNAIEAKYSPWAAPQYQQVQQPGSALGQTLGGAFAGGMTGAQVGGGLQDLTQSRADLNLPQMHEPSIGESLRKGTPTPQLMGQPMEMGAGFEYGKPTYKSPWMGASSLRKPAFTGGY